MILVKVYLFDFLYLILAVIYVPSLPVSPKCRVISNPNIDPVFSALTLPAPSSSSSTGKGVILSGQGETCQSSSTSLYQFSLQMECDPSISSITFTSATFSNCAVTITARTYDL